MPNNVPVVEGDVFNLCRQCHLSGFCGPRVRLEEQILGGWGEERADFGRRVKHLGCRRAGGSGGDVGFRLLKRFLITSVSRLRTPARALRADRPSACCGTAARFAADPGEGRQLSTGSIP